MTRNCKCGGRLHRTDIISGWSEEYQRVLYSDTDPLKANWKCDRCGAVRTQRKRQRRSDGEEKISRPPTAKTDSRD